MNPQCQLWLVRYRRRPGTKDVKFVKLRFPVLCSFQRKRNEWTSDGRTPGGSSKLR